MILFRNIFLISIVSIINGCANFASAPDKGKLVNFKSAYILPFVDPPLGVDPTFKYIIPGAAGSLGVVQGVGIFNTISVLTQLPEAIKRSELISKALEQELSEKEAWRPTLQLANFAADLIKSNGLAVTIADKPGKLANFSNKEINAWYNNDDPTPNYQTLPLDKSPYILEILQSHGISPQSLTMEVRMKLIDPTTEKVLGRVREWDIVDLPKPDEAFQDNGSAYKKIFLTNGQELINKSLRYLGLVP